jgi:hypothetical protein
MSRTFFRLLIVIFLAYPAYAGLSLVLTPGISSGVVTDPNLPQTQAWRVEFQLHGWTVPGSQTNLWDLNGIGATALLLPGNSLRVLNKRDSTAPSVCDLSLSGRSDVLVRLQRDPVAMTFVCELWNYDGSAYEQTSTSITSINPWPYSGGVFGDQYTSASLGFFREFSAIVPSGSQPPVTAAVGNLTDLKFDGSTSDGSGNHHNLSFTGARFAVTPDQVPVAVIKTDSAPFWSNWVSLRAGYPAVLDGSASFSLADAASTVTYQWQQISGPTTLRWSNRQVAKPTISGLIFGNYRFLLEVADASGKKATSILDIGAVATDDNGVVIQANPAADLLFGPMIAFGKNPWQYQDYIALHSATVRAPYINSISPPTWINNLAGTIAFTPFYYTTPNQTTLNGNLGPSDTTIVVTDISRLDVSVLPTVILIGFQGIQEEVRICAVSGNTLTVCYDGRGWRQGLYSEVPVPKAWTSGTAIAQLKTSGTDTHFLTDFCPAGPGEEGQISYSTGTVSVSANSTTITGSGTAWSDPPLAGQRVRIAGHHSGIPFAFFATVAAVGSSTTLTLSRPYPADADSEAGLAYAIIQPQRYIARNWGRPDGTTGQQLSGVSSCESDTQLYQYGPDGIANVSTAPQTGQQYSYSATSWLSEFGPNYYDEVLANYAGYLRSGSSLFLSNARGIGDYWAANPELDQGYVGVTPRHAGITGMVAGAVLDGRVNNWTTIRKMANLAIAGPYSGGVILSSCDTDIREDAYGLSWLALAAMFDPVDTGSPTTPDQRSYWKAQLANAYTRFSGCKGTDYSFPQAYWNPNFGPFTMTSGSATVTGTAIPPGFCNVASTGTITVINGSQNALGTGFVPYANNSKLVISTTRAGGTPYLFESVYTYNSPTSITLYSPFDGDTGTYSYQIEQDLLPLSFAVNASDYVNMNTPYSCRWVNSTTITLNRPFASASGTYQASRYTDLGYGQIVFLNGVNTFAMNLASLGATGAASTGFADLTKGAANWILTAGFNPLNGGLNYARGFGHCEPLLVPRLGCMYGTDPGAAVAARTLNGEAQNAVRLAYQANPTAANLRFGDQFYGAQWGKPGYGNPPYSDGLYLNTLDSDATFSYKWIGFLFGIGMSHQWPAVRLGGVKPPVPVMPSVSFNLSGVPGAVSVLIKVTEPSGAVTFFPCSASPCSVQADARQGAFWYQILYLDVRGKGRLQAEPDIIEVN